MTINCPKCHFKNPSNSKYCKKCGTLIEIEDKSTLSVIPEFPNEDFASGSTFAGRYQIIEELGSGGMGKVYKAKDTKVNEKIALKIISPKITSDKKTIQRFRNELKYARMITHRNVCRMHDLGEDKGTYFITMEYIPGEDLNSILTMIGKLSPEQAVSIAKQVCDGLTEAHALGVVHRDLKPQNVMIDRKGNARIMDFGIAHSLKAEGLTGPDIMIGTPEYMSPEQVETKDTDQRSDIYSLGLILYEMVTGRPPFEGKTPLDIALKHKNEVPLDPRNFNPKVPLELSRLIMKCLEKDREKRYQSAEEIMLELNNIESKMTNLKKILPKMEKTTSKEKKFVSRKPWMIFAVVFIFLTAAAIGIKFIIGTKPPPPSKKNMLVVLPFENLGKTEDEYFTDGITEEITGRLAALHGLGVISRTSAFHYKNTDKTIKQIGEELSVDYVLEGSVRWNRNQDTRGRVRVTSQLVQVSRDTNIWSENYDRVLDDIFSVQSEIAEQVAQKLDLAVLAPERRAMNAVPTKNLRAYDFYLQGREIENTGWASLDTQKFAAAIEMLERATELDPDFALAYVRMSYIHSRMYFFGLDRTEERKTKSREAVNKALELQPELPEAHRELGFYHYWCLSDYDRAAEIFESVMRARPNFDPQLLGYIQRRQGKWEQSITTLERASRISPRDAQVAYELGGAYVSTHKYDQAESQFNYVLSLYPDHLPAKLGLIGIKVLSQGDTKEAWALLKSAPPHPLTDTMWITLNMLERNFKEALDLLARLSYDSFEDQHYYFLKNLAYASVYYAMKNPKLMRNHAQSARMILEGIVSERAEDPRFQAALGLTYAYLGLADQSIQKGTQAVSLHPVSKDAAQGPIYLLNLAKIYTIIGEHENAIDQLEYVFSIPHAEYLWQLISVPQLQLDPQWDSLRDHPRFKRLLL